MTYVREQTSAELAVHIRSLQKMAGWFDPLSDRLWQEVEALQAEVAGLKTGYEAYERVNAELKAECEAYKAVAEQPESLNVSPVADYEGLKRQFFALRNYALCKDKLSGYYSRELEKLRRVDRSQSAEEIDAERNINEQLTNDLLTVEAERDQLKGEIKALRKDAVRLDFIEAQNHKTLRFHKKKWSFEGFTNYEYSVFSSPREAIDAAMDKGEQPEIHHTSWALVHETPPTCAGCGVQMFSGLTPSKFCKGCQLD